ncbi:MAG TPA: flavin reductase family protein [Chitinophaga sp.]|uniref:flavin reductase family protein n=1 Tax=Chitinophaga sp. TaxID=1869181 RepID=UPI002CA83B5C|nr:flavin reductase family protein [Chitinophaga sp.]HVI43434.1 flavin reductase family protein [Chitinophaga sp.]
MHITGEPPILYFGTPVVLISTVNDNGSYNLAPMSSVFWLGWRGVLGLSAFSKTTENMLRTRECVLNLPSADLAGAVNRLARTTGSNPVPEGKLKRGYRYEPEKFATAGLTPAPAEIVNAPLVAECPVQLEARVEAVHEIAADNPVQKGRIVTFEVRIIRVHLHTSILKEDNPDKVDPDKWRPLIMSFQEFYGLGERIHTSTLAEIPEALYFSNDIERARVSRTTIEP